MQYWVTGAMWSGSDDQLAVFLKRGYWYCWEPRSEYDNVPSVLVQQEKLKEVKVGDRIAIKRMLGRGAKEIDIRAIGVVKDLDCLEWRIYVDWVLVFDENNIRRVPFNGAGSSIHGPYNFEDDWIRQIFCI